MFSFLGWKLLLWLGRLFFLLLMFLIFGHQNPVSGLVFSLKWWIRIRTQWIRTQRSTAPVVHRKKMFRFMKARPCCCPCWEEGVALSTLLRCGASPSRRIHQRSQRPWRSVSADHPFKNFCSSILKSCSWKILTYRLFFLHVTFYCSIILVLGNIETKLGTHSTCSHSKKICLLFASSQCSLAFRVINLYIF